MINAQALLDRTFEPKSQTYGDEDCRRYALSIGLGDDPTDGRQLRFVYERDLRVFPTFAATLCTPGQWYADPDTGIDAKRFVYAAQRLTFHHTLPTEARVTARSRISGIEDQGTGRGCVVQTVRDIADTGSGSVLGTVEDTYVCVGQGGFGGPGEAIGDRRALPETDPESTLISATARNAALFYRLNGDRSAFHADPEVARAAGFERPVMHGPCVLAMAAQAILARYADLDPGRLLGVEGRFSAPHLPGETLAVETWRSADGVAFRVLSVERRKKTIDNGFARLAG